MLGWAKLCRCNGQNRLMLMKYNQEWTRINKKQLKQLFPCCWTLQNGHRNSLISIYITNSYNREMVSVLLFLHHAIAEYLRSYSSVSITRRKKTIHQSKIVMFTLKLNPANDKNTRSFRCYLLYKLFSNILTVYPNIIKLKFRTTNY